MLPQEAHLYGALMLYTSNAIYRQLNAALRRSWAYAVRVVGTVVSLGIFWDHLF